MCASYGVRKKKKKKKESKNVLLKLGPISELFCPTLKSRHLEKQKARYNNIVDISTISLE